jgi:hypothetical protein
VLQQTDDRRLGHCSLEAGGVDAEVVLARVHERGETPQPLDLLVEELGFQPRRYHGPAEVADGGAARRRARAQRQAHQVAHPCIVTAEVKAARSARAQPSARQSADELPIVPGLLALQDQGPQQHGDWPNGPADPGQRQATEGCFIDQGEEALLKGQLGIGGIFDEQLRGEEDCGGLQRRKYRLARTPLRASQGCRVSPPAMDSCFAHGPRLPSCCGSDPDACLCGP